LDYLFDNNHNTTAGTPLSFRSGLSGRCRRCLS